jgi:hypothetical protein
MEQCKVELTAWTLALHDKLFVLDIWPLTLQDQTIPSKSGIQAMPVICKLIGDSSLHFTWNNSHIDWPSVGLAILGKIIKMSRDPQFWNLTLSPSPNSNPKPNPKPQLGLG